MAEFKVKNLMIDVVSAEAAERFPDICLFPSGACRRPSLVPCDRLSGRIPCNGKSIACLFDSKCLLSRNPCGLNYSTCFQSDIFVLDLNRLVINPSDVDIIRKQLNDVMEAVKERGAEVSESMRPQTLEQAEFLEQKLTEALEEVRNMKQQLSARVNLRFDFGLPK